MKNVINWQEIMSDSSRKCIENASRILIKNPKEVTNLIELGFSGVPRYSGRAVRAIYYALQIDNTLFKKELSNLVWRYKDCPDESVEFHFMGIFYMAELPKKQKELAELTNICFAAFDKTVQRIAIKVYAAETLFKIANKFPAMKNEVISVLMAQSEDEHMSLKITSKRIIKELMKSKK